MNQLNHVISHLENYLEKFNLERINTGRVSDDWKAKIFGHRVYKQQIGIYKRDTMILVRLEKYDADITGVSVYPKIPKGDSWEASFSRFKGGKGVCLKVDTVESFKDLLDWYFPNAQ